MILNKRRLENVGNLSYKNKKAMLDLRTSFLQVKITHVQTGRYLAKNAFIIGRLGVTQ
jgi:hypothetical protein